MQSSDVIIVGAGLSGIGAAVYLAQRCPKRRFLILEARDAIGGTWDLFRYPGIRSDSDMHTLGYSFKPWLEAKAIADGPSILNYIRETASDYLLENKILFGHKVVRSEWMSDKSKWLIEAEIEDRGELAKFESNFLHICAGYYSYSKPYDPVFVNQAGYQGQLVHPQFWPKNLDYRGKRVLVIGSGATAMTLVPAMARDAKEVIMLQRSPSYVISRPAIDRWANFLRIILPDMWAYSIIRIRNTLGQQWLYYRTRVAPNKVKEFLLGKVRQALGEDFDVGKHFTPKYNPWDQRMCLIPDDDLFEVINSGSARIVTDEIKSFTSAGVALMSGEELKADIVITATGLQLNVMGDIKVTVDGQIADFSQCWTYKGLMLTNVPNLTSTFGYINASWTLRADLTAEWLCRVLNYMDVNDFHKVVPQLPDELKDMPTRPWISDFNPGYMNRVMHLLPNQGDREPWINPQSYFKDRKMFRRAVLEDGFLRFSKKETAYQDKISNSKLDSEVA